MRKTLVFLFVLLFFILVTADGKSEKRYKKYIKRQLHTFKKEIYKIKKETKKFKSKNRKEMDELRKENKKLNELITEYEKVISELKNPPIAHLTTTLHSDNKVFVWNVQIIPLDPKVFKLSKDMKQITFLRDGVYRFDLQLLPRSGNWIYPYVVLNGKPILYGYGGGTKDYATANMHFVLKLKANDVISVHHQDSNPVYTGSSTTHYFFIQKVA